MGAGLCADAGRSLRLGLRPPLVEETDSEGASEPEPIKINPRAKSWQKKSSPHKKLGTLSVKKGKSREHVNSLTQRLQERASKNTSSEFIIGEQESKMYMDVLQDDTVYHLSEVMTITNLMVGKNEDILDELARQEDVIQNGSNDIFTIDQDISESSYNLHGMKSIGGKISNMLKLNRRHKPCRSHCSLPNERRTRIRSLPEPNVVPSLSSGETKQKWIETNVKQLNSTMDIIKDQQMDITEVLSNEEGKLNQFENSLGDIDVKMKSQTQLMHSMRKS